MIPYPYITAPHNATVVTLADARAWLRMDVIGFVAEDEAIIMALSSAVNRVETYCNVQLGVSEFEYLPLGVPCMIPDVKHIREISSVEVRQEDGSYLEFASDNYDLVRTGKISHRIDWNVVPQGKLRIRFTAGLETVPPQLLQAIRAMLSEYFDNRSDGVSEKKTLSEKLMDDFFVPYAG